MVFLCILLGIIVLFTVILSIRFKIYFEYDNTVSCYAKWLFLKIPLYPAKEKKAKAVEDSTSQSSEAENQEVSDTNTENQENADGNIVNIDGSIPLNEDTEENAEYDFEASPIESNTSEALSDVAGFDDNSDNSYLDKSENSDNNDNSSEESKDKKNKADDEEQAPMEAEPILEERVIQIDDTKKSKKPKGKKNKQAEADVNPNSITDFKALFTTYYDNEGIDGIIELAGRLLTALDHFARRSVHWFVLDELYVTAVITSGDAASTAEKYGKYCSAVFPLFGNLIARFNVKKYNIDISSDYLANKGDATFVFTLSIIPRKALNTVFVLIYDIVVKFFLKLLKHGRLPKNTDNNSTENK